MARYTGPKLRISRRFREPIFGMACEHQKGKGLRKKPYPPGEHGRSRRRKKSDYGVRLEAKQKAKFIYGMLERQFRRFFKMASRMKGNTGENFIRLLESRLDNVVYRMGFAPTRPSARQLVTHKHFRVNGVVVNVPSYLVKPGDIIEVREKSKDIPIIVNAIQRSDFRRFSWIEVDKKAMKGKFLQYPERNEVPEKIEERYIVEFYSR